MAVHQLFNKPVIVNVSRSPLLGIVPLLICSAMGIKSLLLVLPVALAFQLPFKLPFFAATSVPSIDNVPEPPTSPRVAIIGAGAAGSSAAFWISKAKERFGVDVEIDVYEQANYVGGRKFCCA